MDDPTYWTARVAMLLYAGALAILAVPGLRAPGAARLLYTAGCAALLVHIATAFQLHHHWSHAAARAHVEQRTAELTGVPSGAGLWLNYLFAVAWMADAAYWWTAGDDRYRRRPLAYSLVVHGFLLFIAFNAAVVFATGTARVVGSVVAAVLALAAVSATRRPRHTSNLASLQDDD